MIYYNRFSLKITHKYCYRGLKFMRKRNKAEDLMKEDHSKN